MGRVPVLGVPPGGVAAVESTVVVWSRLPRVGKPSRPGQLDGLNQDDTGVALLAQAVRDIDPARVLLVCSGELPGARKGMHRLILDLREQDATSSKVLPIAPDGLDAPIAGVDTAVVWPRAHLGKDFTLQCLARALRMLPPGGRLFCAVRKQKGANSIADAMGELFGNVDVVGRERGYRLLESVRPDSYDEQMVAERLSLRYTIQDPALGELTLNSAPGVFSRKALDSGTRCLIEHLERTELTPGRVLDLCAGVGPLGLAAARRWPRAQVLAVESNIISAALCGENVVSNGLSERMRVVPHAGLPKDKATAEGWMGRTDLTLTNPPTHSDAETLCALFRPLGKWHRRGGRCFAVVTRPGTVSAALKRAGAKVLVPHTYAHYTVLEASWEPAEQV